MPEKIAYRFVGPTDADGLALAFHGGIPATNLTEADLEALTPEQKLTVAGSALYKAAATTTAAPATPAATHKEST